MAAAAGSGSGGRAARGMPNSDATVTATTRMATMWLSQENIEWILARTELCTDDTPDIERYIPFVPDDDVDEDHLPEIYYDEPEALLVHVNGVLKATWAKFRDFQSWVHVEDGSNGFVEVEYDVDEFEETQRLQEERRLWRAHVWEKISTDDPPEEGEFAEYVSVYDQEKRAFVMRPKELEEGTRTIAVFDKVKMKLVLKKLEQ